jgi:tetratricopeptide (TPR) repeat protein
MLDAEDDEHVWSATFEEDLEDIMILQSRVVQAIAGQVRVTLSADEQERFENVSAVNPAAYEAFLKGQFHVERFTPKDMELAEGYYREAVELDPEYALGYWGLAKLCGFRNQAGVITPEEAREQCDPLLPEAHLGYANHMTWRRFDWENAATAFERAIELNPSYAEARMFYSHYLGIVGRLEESTEQTR